VLFGIVLLLCIAIYAFFSKEKNNSYEDYKEDVIFNIKWRWGYSYGKISNLVAYCPKCDYQLHYVDISNYGLIPKICFVCENCNQFTSQEFNKEVYEVEDTIKRKIALNIRNMATKQK